MSLDIRCYVSVVFPNKSHISLNGTQANLAVMKVDRCLRYVSRSTLRCS